MEARRRIIIVAVTRILVFAIANCQLPIADCWFHLQSKYTMGCSTIFPVFFLPWNPTHQQTKKYLVQKRYRENNLP